MRGKEPKLFNKKNFHLLIVGVVTGVILWALTGERMWDSLGNSALVTSAKLLLTTDVTVSTTVLGILLVLPFIVLWRMWPRNIVPVVRGTGKFDIDDEPATDLEPEPPALKDLTRDHVSIMRYMATGVAQTTSKEVSERLEMQLLIADQACDRLVNIGLLRDSLNKITGRHFHLSDMGRDFAIEHGLIS